jgi:hypothetical protein
MFSCGFKVWGGLMDFSQLGQLGRAHSATFGPMTLSAHQPLCADIMLTSAPFLIKIVFYFQNDYSDVL